MEKPREGITGEEAPTISDKDLIVPEEGEECYPDEETEKWRFKKEFDGNLINEKTSKRRANEARRTIKDYFKEKEKKKKKEEEEEKYGKQEELSLDNKK